jgi:uncharacterized membrane protein HdeD (DUF308 family)
MVKNILVGVGIFSIGISFMVFVNPLLGLFILTFMLGVNLLIIGVESIVHGVSGNRNMATSIYLHLLLPIHMIKEQ